MKQRNDNGPMVETRSGRLRGLIQCSILGEHYHAFKGIPYAKLPVGEFRFQDPVPAEAWTGVRNATEHGPISAQCDFVTKTIEGSDDCLYLNVYSKNLRPHNKQPVMVWIHGGCFVVGDGNEHRYGPDYFMRKDVVLVTINYRLGVLGFLNLEDEVATGNQGLKDQVLALKWVRDNISGFGGDHENITIFGESAGSASVHYLTLSPMAKGLFDKAICQSGVVLNPWTYQTSNPKRFAYKMCELLGSKTRDPDKVVEFLKTIDTKKLIEIQDQLLTNEERVKFMFPFGPGVDAKSKNPFMPVHPEIAAKEGVKVPLLIGYNNREGILFMEIARNQVDKLFPTSKSKFEKFLNPNTTDFLKTYNLFPDDLRRLYFKNADITKENFDSLIDLMGDVHFVEGIHRVVEIQVEKSCSSTYLYKYSYDKTVSPFKRLLKATHIKGANHADEMQHQFRSKLIECDFKPLEKGSVQYKIMEQMIELWVNFATTGRPTPTFNDLIPLYWQPVENGTVLRYLNIDEDPQMEKTLNLKLRFTSHEFRKSAS